MNILDYIPTGSGNAVSRAALCRMTGMDDRSVRREIAKSREAACICNDQENGGYYLPETAGDAERYYRQEKKRALAILKRLRGARLYHPHGKYGEL